MAQQKIKQCFTIKHKKLKYNKPKQCKATAYKIK